MITPSAGTFWKLAAVSGLVLWLGFRLALMPRVMTHTDDIGPSIGLLQNRSAPFNARMRALKVWTYAPLQFVLTDRLLTFAHNPRQTVFWGRLPSFLFWIAGIGLFASLLGRLAQEDPLRWPIELRGVLVLWALLSWRGVIESSQGYNYAAAFFASAFFLRFSLPEAERRRLLAGGVGALIAAVLAIVVGVELSYQMIFFAAALGLALFFREGFGSDRARLGHLAFLFAVLALSVWLASRSHLGRFSALRGHPPWAPYPHGLGDLIRGWFDVAQNALAILPWGWPTIALTAMTLLLAAIGWWRRSNWPLLWTVLGLGLVWSIGAWRLRFPCGATRHTFILQLPVLLFVGAGWGALRLSRKIWLTAGFSMLALSLLAFPNFYRGIKNQVDLAEIETLMQNDPDLVVEGAFGAYTRDALLLLADHPDWVGRLGRKENAPAPQRLLLVSHRGPMQAVQQADLARGGYHLEVLRAVPPIASTELSGDINGGNGFYLYLASLQAP